MEKGILSTRGDNVFIPEGQKLPVSTPGSLKKARAIRLPPNPWSLDLTLHAEFPVAYACRGCKKIIIDYED